jgi:hypothetical protein
MKKLGRVGKEIILIAEMAVIERDGVKYFRRSS